MGTETDLKIEYDELQAKYDKLCAFLYRVEEGSSPIHDDYPVAELYEQKGVMEQRLNELKAKAKAIGVGV